MSSRWIWTGSCAWREGSAMNHSLDWRGDQSQPGLESSHLSSWWDTALSRDAHGTGDTCECRLPWGGQFSGSVRAREGEGEGTCLAIRYRGGGTETMKPPFPLHWGSNSSLQTSVTSSANGTITFLCSPLLPNLLDLWGT